MIILGKRYSISKKIIAIKTKDDGSECVLEISTVNKTSRFRSFYGFPVQRILEFLVDR